MLKFACGNFLLGWTLLIEELAGVIISRFGVKLIDLVMMNLHLQPTFQQIKET